MSVDEQYLKENDFILLSTSPQNYYILRVLDAKPIVLDYYPQVQETGFLPLNAFGGAAVSGAFNNYILDKLQLGMQEYTNITNIFDADDMNFVGTNTLMQIFMGIAPSPLRIFRYYPSQDPLGEYLDGNQVIWGGRQQEYNLGYVDGFMSPVKEPTYSGEFFMLPVFSQLFALENPSSVPIYPFIKFYINQMVVEPVYDTTLAGKILDRIVPSRKVSVGEFNKGFKPNIKLFGINPVPLTASANDLKEAGY